MGLLDLFNQWIIERGSAIVQEKHLAYLRDILVNADREITALRSEVTALRSENAVLRSEITVLKNENAALKTENNSLKAENKHLKLELQETKRDITQIAVTPKAIHGPNLSLKYGIYWDNEGNPHCPLCKSPMAQTQWATHINSQYLALKCPCSTEPFLLMDNGQPIQAPDAIKAMLKRTSK